MTHPGRPSSFSSVNRFELNEALGRDLMGYRVVPRGEGSFLLVTRKGSPVSAFSKAAR